MEQVATIIVAFKEKFIESNDTLGLALLLELQQELFHLQQGENQTEASSSLLGNDKITFKNGSYYQGDNGPYCANCWEKDSSFVLMNVTPRKARKSRNAECPQCGTILVRR